MFVIMDNIENVRKLQIHYRSIDFVFVLYPQWNYYKIPLIIDRWVK